MYSACLFCHAGLGANEAVEQFPIGRRLAFDAAKGRLWVVCTGCGRWNLTPLEERWEAIETCERLYRTNPLRASTDNIGMTRAPDGTVLVRIGQALRPEIAAWRYGRQLQRRFWKFAGTRVAGAFGVGVMTGSIVTGAVPLATAAILFGLGGAGVWAGWQSLVAERVTDAHGRTLDVTRGDLAETRLLADERGAGWAVFVRHTGGVARLEGGVAARALGRLLVHVNLAGASEHALAEAEQRLAAAGDVDGFIASTAHAMERAAHQERMAQRRTSWWHNESPDLSDRLLLLDLHPFHRLALEMSLHDETERAALAGELAALEAAWREAEEIARIADGLVLPAAVTRRLAELRVGRSPSPKGDQR